MHDTDRAAYHHGDLRKTLMEACCTHIAEHGTEGLSLRALAREAGVSATAPYRHFDSRQSLLAALATEGFEELASSMDREVLEGDSVCALFEMGRAYVRYARQNPVKYHLMFGGAVGDFSAFESLLVAANDCYAVLEGILLQGQQHGDLCDGSLAELGGTVWAMVHGLAGLTISAEEKQLVCAEGPVPDGPPLRAQHAVATAPERALLRLMEGLVKDRSRLAPLQREWGVD